MQWRGRRCSARTSEAVLTVAVAATCRLQENLLMQTDPGQLMIMAERVMAVVIVNARISIWLTPSWFDAWLHFSASTFALA